MLLRRKTKKIILIIVCSFLGLIALAAIGLAIYIADIPLDNYYNHTHYICFSEDEGERLQAEGYTINSPWFEDTSSFGMMEEWPIYNEIVDPLQCYAMDVCYTFRNYAKLDYTVTLENDTLTIAFTGWGYPDMGKGEPLCLDKVYVFDVSNVSVENLPRLVSVTAEDPDAVYEFMQRMMRDELKYDNDEEKWYEKVEGEWVETEMPEVLEGIKGD